jgi:tetratricopeptide (TPR) repeat protein
VVVRKTAVAAIVLLAVLPGATIAQATAGEGRTLERRGLYEDAATTYRAVLENDRVSVAAWLGLERALSELDRLDSIVPVLDSTILSEPGDGFLRELQLRVWSNLNLPDSVTAVARRWTETSPDNPNPYRQWAHALASVGNTSDAISVLEEARLEFGESALAPEMAVILASGDQWVAAVGEWRIAVVADRSNLAAAGLALRQVPESHREDVLAALLDSAEPIERRLAAELLVSWDRPDEGWALLEDALSSDRAEAATELSLFVDRVRRLPSKDAARARAYALERLVDLVEGPDAERARLDAALAFADAGDFAGARRMLEGLIDVSEGVPNKAGEAVAAIIRVTAESGEIDEAEERLRSWEARLMPSDAQLLRERIGWAWIIRGEPDRAMALLQSDSSVGAFAILGWAALFGGDLTTARANFLAAGPFAVSRDQSTRRTSMLALLQGVEPDTVAELGEALLWLERADTSRAMEGLEEVAHELPADGGRSPILTLMGDIAREGGDLEQAESLFIEALHADSLGPSAPAAEYALGAVLAGSGKGDAAVERLEHMILTHPGSALVPEARRLLDQVRGAIPRQ